MVLMPMEGRNFDNPKRGVLDRDDQERPESRDPERPGTTDRGQRDSDSVYDRESKVMRARPLVERIRWMPWQSEAMKDVVACDKLRGVGKQTLIRRSLNGGTQPA